MPDRTQTDLEAELLQARRLATVGLLAGGVAHDFNNRVAAILLQVSLLHLKRPLDAEVRATLAQVEVEALLAADLTRLLSLFGRRSTAQMTTVNVNERVERLLKIVRRLVGEQHEVVWRPHPGLPLVTADAGMIDQLIVSLCVNAGDAMAAGEQLSLSSSTKTVAADEASRHGDAPPGRFACLTVSGTGQVSDAQVLHEIATQHRGWIDATSEPGDRPTLRLWLPAMQSSVTVNATDGAGPVHGGTETILLVEDEPPVRDAASAYLRQLGYTVLEAENGVTANALWRTPGPSIDLLYTDVIMPGGMNGLELAEVLRRESPRLKVMISSGYHEGMVRQGLPERSDLLYVAKPCRGRDLAWAVRMCLDHPQA